MIRDWNNIETHRNALDEYYTLAQQRASKWHTAVADYEKDYFLEQAVEDGESKRTDLKDIVDQMVNVLDNGRFKISLRRPGNSFVDREMAEAGERYLHHVFDTIDQRKGYRIRTRLLHNMLAKSAGVLHWVYTPNPVAGLEDVVDPHHIPPVDLFVVDPLNFYPVLGGPLGQFQYVCHVEQLPLQEIVNMVNTTFTDWSGAMAELQRWYVTAIHSDNVYEQRETKDTLINYWGWHNVGGKWMVFNAVKYGNAVLRPFTPMPAYRVLPWSVAVAHDTGDGELHKRWLPITYSAREHTKRLERLQNRIDILTEKIADQPFIFHKSRESGNNPQVAANSSYVITLEEGERFDSPDYKSLSPDFWRQLDQAQSQLEKASLPATMFGGTGVETGTNFGTSNEGGRLRFIRPRDSLVFAYVQAIRGVMSFVYTLAQGEPIYQTILHKQNKQARVVIRGADLAPASWDIKVTLDAQLPGDETRNMTLAQMAVGSRLMSRYQARERFLGIEDPQAESEMIMMEDAQQNDPRITSAYAYKVLYEMDALPDLTGEQYMEVWNAIESIRARGAILGVSEQEINAYIERILFGLKAELHTRAMMTQGQARSPMSPETTPPQDPQMGGALAENGALMRTQAGFAAPGSNGDPGTQLRDMANAMNGVVGQRQ